MIRPIREVDAIREHKLALDAFYRSGCDAFFAKLVGECWLRLQMSKGVL